jgi:hypothetical protein
VSRAIIDSPDFNISTVCGIKDQAYQVTTTDESEGYRTLFFELLISRSSAYRKSRGSFLLSARGMAKLLGIKVEGKLLFAQLSILYLLANQ